MWDNTHLLVFALHWDYLQLLKYFHHLTITAINHGGRNCRVLNTKQKCCSTNQDLWIKRTSTEVSRIQPNFSESVRIHLWVNSCQQVLIYKTSISSICRQTSRSRRFWIIQNNVPWFDLTLTVHLPEKYTSGNLRYFQYCCITHLIPLHVSLKHSLKKKRLNNENKNNH